MSLSIVSRIKIRVFGGWRTLEAVRRIWVPHLAVFKGAGFEFPRIVFNPGVSRLRSLITPPSELNPFERPAIRIVYHIINY